MNRVTALLAKELRSGLPTFLALFAAVNWKLGVAAAFSAIKGLDPAIFFDSGLEYDEKFPWFWLPSIVVFWAGLRAFAPEWRARTMTWLKTMPLSDGTVAGVKLTAGLAQLFLALFVGFLLRNGLWLVLGGSYGWKGSNLLWFLAEYGGGLFLTTLWLAPAYLLGALVSASVTRRWIAMGIAVGAWFGLWTAFSAVLLALTENPANFDRVGELMRFQISYPAIAIPAFAVLVALLTGLTIRTHGAREIAG